MAETLHERKLASIVAIDMAGYSRRTEADEEAAIKALASLKTLIGKAAAAHGGRVFNTAGDGFMLEFPTASGALSAADEIARSADPPVRVGVHLGEVFVTGSGDLLGHGVNVAARIQQMASPGAVLVSGDVKRAIRGPVAGRLRPQGSIRLDKMSETLPVFALAPAEGGRAKGRRRDLRRWAATGAVAACLCLLALSAWMSRSHWLTPPRSATHIAIMPLETVGSAPGLPAFAAGVSDNLQSVLASGPAPIVSEADAETLRGPGRDRQLKALGVGLLLGGTARGDGDAYAVHLHLDDPLHHATLWTGDFSGPAAMPDPLQARIGGQTIAMLNCATQAVKPIGGLSDSSALSLFLRGCSEFENIGDYNAQNIYGLLDTFRRLTVLAPEFAPGHSALAKFVAYFYPRLPPDQAPALRQEADREAHRALALDPNDADAYVALQVLAPTADYAKRESLLRKGLQANPAWPYLNGFLGGVLYDVGRLKDAAGYLERATAANPQSMDFAGAAAEILVMTGQASQGNAAFARLSTTWPGSLSLWEPQYDSLFAQSRWNDLARLGPVPGAGKQEADCFRIRLDALKSRRAADVVAARDAILRGLCANDPFYVRISTLSALGLIDDAFTLAAQFTKARLTTFNSTDFLFRPQLAPLRRDPRFMALAARVGLVDYWRGTGNWPDFCAEPGLPYDCKVEAAKHTGRAGG